LGTSLMFILLRHGLQLPDRQVMLPDADSVSKLH
jgi:hypothetical protein